MKTRPEVFRESPRKKTTTPRAVAPDEMAGPELKLEEETSRRWDEMLRRLPTDRIVGAIETVRDASKRGSEFLEQAGDWMGHQFIKYYGPEITAGVAEVLRKLQKIRFATALTSAAVMLAAASNPELVTAVGLQIDNLIQMTAVGLSGLGLGPHEAALATNVLHGATDLLHLRLTAHAAEPGIVSADTHPSTIEGPSEARFVHGYHPPAAPAEAVPHQPPHETAVSTDLSESAARQEAAEIRTIHGAELHRAHEALFSRQQGWGRAELPDNLQINLTKQTEIVYGIQDRGLTCFESAVAAADQMGEGKLPISFESFQSELQPLLGIYQELPLGGKLEIPSLGIVLEKTPLELPLDLTKPQTTLSDIIGRLQTGATVPENEIKKAEETFINFITRLSREGKMAVVEQNGTQGIHTGAIVGFDGQNVVLSDGNEGKGASLKYIQEAGGQQQGVFIKEPIRGLFWNWVRTWRAGKDIPPFLTVVSKY